MRGSPSGRRIQHSRKPNGIRYRSPLRESNPLTQHPRKPMLRAYSRPSTDKERPLKSSDSSKVRIRR
jgi:hypothetical protein